MSDIATGTIVVGVDGSPSSEAAPGWAPAEARHHGYPVVAIFAWHRHHALMIGPIPVEFGMEWTSERVRAGHQAVLDKAVRAGNGSGVCRTLAEGDPKSVLIEASRSAVLLVAALSDAGQGQATRAGARRRSRLGVDEVES
ncbi:universal stress protein [Lentzea sp. NPDC042327]|uniref:universal stress protein n=1 Tax=Lentzea sp. NPDC042327 TaxID=3154801 RepID=UPI003403C648